LPDFIGNKEKQNVMPVWTPLAFIAWAKSPSVEKWEMLDPFFVALVTEQIAFEMDDSPFEGSALLILRKDGTWRFSWWKMTSVCRY
jgi:hypothetical protein